MIHILQGDCRTVLARLAPASVHCVVTSPPYLGQRDYGSPWQIGLEASPEAYVAQMVGAFREVRRVMRSDATLWLNLGDATRDKQVLGMPWRVAFALQADGWMLRSAIVWAKPSCMPESATDRPSNVYEQVFLLTKAGRYFYDGPAINDGANAKNVWTIATTPTPLAHFAVMPAELAERCIKAGTPEHGVCATCGTPWKRIVHRGQSDYARLGKVKGQRGDSTPNGYGHTRAANGTVPSLRARSVIATDWKRGCRCQGVGRVRATVLDPFAGAFTTALAADRLGRNAIGIELSERYCRIARERLEDDAGLFAALSEQAPNPFEVADPQPGLAL